MSPWWLLRSSLCQDFVKSWGINGVKKSVFTHHFPRAHMGRNAFRQSPKCEVYPKKENNRKNHLIDVNSFKSSICKHCTELGQDLLFVVQNP